MSWSGPGWNPNVFKVVSITNWSSGITRPSMLSCASYFALI